MSGVRLSVIIPVLDNRTGLQRTLAALTPQLAARDDVEVIVVDDGSSDGSGDEAASILASTARGRVRRIEHAGPGAARNRGAESSTGRMLAFVDANDEPLAGWVDLFAAERPDTVGVVHAEPRLDDPTLDTHYAHLLPGCFAVARDLFEAVNGYDEALRFAENTDLVERCHRAAHAGGRDVERHDEVLLAVHDITDPRRYDERRADAMHHLLRRDADVADRTTLARYARVGAVAAARCGRVGDARRMALLALRQRPWSPRDWARLVLIGVAPLRRRRWPA